MRVKDFNRQKSNGGTTTASTVNEIRTFKYKKGNIGNSHRARGSSGKACSKCSTLYPPNVQHLAKSVTNVDTKTISALVVGRNKRAREMATIKDHSKVGVQRDITDLKADAPDKDPEADPTHEVPIA